MKFDWSLPTNVRFGCGRFSEISKHVKGLGKKAFIVTSPSFNDSRKSILDALLAQLKSIDVEALVFSEVEPNPRTSTIDRAVESARIFKPRYVIALGGGSVMDASKCIAMLSINEGLCSEYAYTGPGKKRKRFNHALPLVCIPTVAATSSETDSYAVVTDWENKKKVVVFGDTLQPAISIIDPELTFTVGPRQTVDSSFDIITHVIEEYLSSETGGFMQDRLSEAVIETVVRYLPQALSDPKNIEARTNLSWAASFALSGALNGRDGSFPIHALEHGLSAITDISHGRGLAFILPRKMIFDSSVIGEKINHFNKRIFGTTSMNDGLIKYMREVGAWTDLSDISGNSEDLIEKTIEHAFEIDAITPKDEDPYLDNIRPIYKKDAYSILSMTL